MQGYRDFVCWQESFSLVGDIYRLTRRFPEEEKFGLVAQMRRAAISIPSNLAEGYRRRNREAWRHFVRIAYGSAAELETQLMLSQDLGLVIREEVAPVLERLGRVSRLLNGPCDYLGRETAASEPRTTRHVPRAHSYGQFFR
jgi:four helix bundle protein